MDYEKLMKLKKDGTVQESHTAWCRGYVSRKTKEKDYPVERYSGRYGKGYVVYSPSTSSSEYCHKTYFIETEKPKKSTKKKR